MLAGRYEIIRTLGRGAVGELLLARDNWAQGTTVAVKVLAPPVSAPQVTALETEFRILREISHPHIVAALDFGRLGDGRAYFTMEYVDGTDIVSEWRRLKPAEGFDLLLQICSALQCLHTTGYVHGDLKAENILVRRLPARLIKLVDFGHAALRGTRGLELRGTLACAPPEVLTGGAVDLRSDLYAYGVLLYRLLAGRFPFGEGPAAAKGHLERRPPELRFDPQLAIPDDLTGRLNDLVARLLAKRPAQRPRHIAVVASELAAARLSLAPRPPGGRRRAEPRRRTALGAPLRAPFVGRRALLAQLNHGLRDVVHSGKAGTVVLSGPPGIGKSRTLDVFKTGCQLGDGLMLSVSCLSTAADPSSRAVLPRILEQLCQALPPDAGTIGTHGAELLKIAPRLAQRADFRAVTERVLEQTPGTRRLPPRAERIRHWDEVAEFFVQQARRRPLVLCFREADLAGEEIQPLIAALLRRPSAAPILICLTSSASPLPEWLGKTGDPDPARRLLSVRGLSAAETANLIRSLLAHGWLGQDRTWSGREPPAAPSRRVWDEVARRVHLVTKGNPLQITEMARSLARTGAPSEWNRPELLAKIPLPENLAASIKLRLDSLPPEAVRMLRYLAHARRPVPETVLLAAERHRRASPGRGTKSPVLASPRALLESGLALRIPRGAEILWDLADPRDAVAIASLTGRAEERRLHADLATALRRYGRATPARTGKPALHADPALLEQLAHHCLEAGDAERGVPAQLRAARIARRLHAYRHALELLQRCLPAARKLSRASEAASTSGRRPGKRARSEVQVLLEMADLTGLLGDPSAEEQVLRGLRSPSCRSLLTVAESARVERRRGALAMMRGRHRQAARYLAGAAALLEQAPDQRAKVTRSERVRVATTTAMLQIHRGASAEALETCAQALTSAGPIATATKRGLAAEVASLFNFSAIASLYTGDARRALRHWARAHRTYRRAGEPAGMAGVLNNLGKFHMDRGDLRRARAVLRRSIAQRRRLRDVDGVADSLNNLGIIEIMSGRLPRAERILEAGRCLRRRVGDRFGETLATANLAEVDLLAARYTAAEQRLESALRFMQTAGHARLLRGLTNSLAALWLATGRHARAERELKKLVADAAASNDPLQQGIALAHLGECARGRYLATGRGSLRRARQHLAAAREIFTNLPHRYHLGLTLARLILLEQTARDSPTPQDRDPRSAAPADRETLRGIARALGSVSLQAWAELLHGNDLWLASRGATQAPSRRETDTMLMAYDHAEQLARRNGLREILWQAHLGAARACRLAGRFRRAHNRLREGLTLLGEMQRELRGISRRRAFLLSGGRAAMEREVELLARAAGLPAE